MAESKKKINLNQNNLDDFYGTHQIYKPSFEHYNSNKAGFGMWDFEIKFLKETPASIFRGIYRNGFIDFLTYHGFFKRYREDGSCFLLRCIDNAIEEIEPIRISDFVMQFLDKDGADIVHRELIGDKEVPLIAPIKLQKETIRRQHHGIFNIKFLELLPNFEKEILKDTPTECYKLFQNKIVKITASGIDFLKYSELGERCVWKKHIKKFDFTYTDNFIDSHYYQFIRNVSNASTEPDRFKAFISSIGYLLHNYNSPEKGQAIICYDEVITDINKPQGGTGKGVFGKALSFIAELAQIDGKKFDENDRFCFQRIYESTQIVFFDDVKTKQGFDRFNSILTDGWKIEKKNKDEFIIKAENSPKSLFSSNSIFECEGSTRKRRQFALEFSGFYSKHIIKGNEEPIKDHHNCIFFSKDWDDIEWQMFYSFMIFCIREFMKHGLSYYEPKNINTNRLRQITNDDFAEWILTQEFEDNKRYETKTYFLNFKEIYYGDDEKFSQRKFTGFLKKYATIYNKSFTQPQASGGITYFEFKKIEITN